LSTTNQSIFLQDFKSEFRPRNRSFNYKHLRDPDNEEERRLFSDQHLATTVESPRKKRKKSKNRNSDSKGSTGSSSSGRSKENFLPKDRNRNKTMGKPLVNVCINSGDIEPVNV